MRMSELQTQIKSIEEAPNYDARIKTHVLEEKDAINGSPGLGCCASAVVWFICFHGAWNLMAVNGKLPSSSANTVVKIAFSMGFISSSACKKANQRETRGCAAGGR